MGTFSQLRKTSVDVFNRPNIRLTSFGEEVDQGEDNYDTVDEDVPVHGLGRRMWSHREKCEEERNTQIEDRDTVDPYTRRAKAKARRKQWLFSPPFEEYAVYRDHVRGQQGACPKRRNGVESCRASDIDHGEKNCNTKCYGD